MNVDSDSPAHSERAETPTPQSPSRRFHRGKAVTVVALAPLAAWACTALTLCLPLPGGLRPSVPFVVILAASLVLWHAPSLRRAILLLLGISAAGILTFLAQRPSHNRDWSPEVSALPWAEMEGDRITIHNIRTCSYRSEHDFDLRYRDDTFDMSRLTDVDLFQVYWGSSLIAHTMLSFGFDDGRRVCLSVETRRERGERYDALKGFFRQYELICIWGDETDLVRLRTDFRGEQVFVYRLCIPLERERQALLAFLQLTNDIRDQPQWYNALLDNCTTTLIGHTRAIINPDAALDWRWIANGSLHEVMHERGTIDSSVPLETLRQRGFVNGRAAADLQGVDYSRRIRQY